MAKCIPASALYKHRAPLIEIGLDPSYVLEEARRARSRKWTRDLLLLVPAFPIMGGLFEYFDHSYVGFEDVIGSMLPFILLTSVIVFIHQVISNGYVKKLIFIETPNSPSSSDHNVVVSGGYSPFAGYGFDLDSWSFTVDTAKPFPGKENTWTASSPTELLDYVSKAVVSNVASATYVDKIFVNGRDIRHNKSILETPTVTPRTSISEEVVRDKIGRTDEHIRHYRVISIPIWEGHLHQGFCTRTSYPADSVTGKIVHSHSVMHFACKPIANSVYSRLLGGRNEWKGEAGDDGLFERTGRPAPTQQWNLA